MINLFLITYLLVFITVFWHDWTYKDRSCIANLSWWTMVYLLIHILHIIRKVIIVLIWYRTKDPTIAQTKLDLASIPFLVLPEVVWYIYGNTLVWRQTIMQQCLSYTRGEVFYWSVIGLIYYGYMYVLFFICTFVSFLAIWYMYSRLPF